MALAEGDRYDRWWRTGIAFAFPLVWLVVGAFWPDRQPLAAIWLMPEQFRPMPANFVTAWQTVPIELFINL